MFWKISTNIRGKFCAVPVRSGEDGAEKFSPEGAKKGLLF
jgi:hypothetical protein